MAMTTATGTSRPWRTGILAGMAFYLDEFAIGMLSGLLTLLFALGAVVGGHRAVLVAEALESYRA